MEILFLIPWLVILLFIIVGVIISTRLFRRIHERNQAHKALDTDLFRREKRE
jgi:uncharacterized membrane-anchored protein YhcB (DUF1043 family)